jgi:hypothetical protein
MDWDKKHQAGAAGTCLNLFPDELPLIPAKKGLHPVAPHSARG